MCGSNPAVKAPGLTMKKLLLLCFAAGLLCCGCVNRYVITLSNGGQIVTRNKPRLEGTAYVYKDSTGEKSQIPAFRVRQIAPYSMSQEDKSYFNPIDSK